MTDFVTTLYRSLTDPPMYRLVIRRSFLWLTSYLLLWYCCFGLLVSAGFYFRYAPAVETAILEALQLASQSFPPEATLSISGNRLSVAGVTQPIMIPLPQGSPLNLGFLAVISPSDGPPATESASSLFTFTPTGGTMYHPNLSSPPRIEYDQLSLDGTYTGQQINEFLAMTRTQLSTINPLIPILTLAILLVLATLPLNLLYAAITAGLLRLFSGLQNIPLNLATYFKLTLVTLVAAEAVNTTTTVLYGQATPIIFNLAFLGLTTTALLSLLRPDSKR